MFNYRYSYICPGCKSELDYRSTNKAPDTVMCVCGMMMNMIAYWAKNDRDIR